MKESTSHSRVVLPLHEQGIAIYSRKSRFTGKGESVGNQIELCRQYLRVHEPDAPEPEIFEDDGFSGGDLNRPAFRRMMRAAEAGRFRMLIVYRLDRISRSIGDFTALIERLAQLNVAFVSIREQFDTSTPMGRAMMYIASVFSQLERETIAERIRDNLRELAKTGRWLGGITPTGFASEAVQAVTVDGRTKRACRLRLLPEEAETVKAMYSLFARLGSLTAVVKGLQERSITTKNGNAFTRHAVRDILHNPVYARADADMLAWLRAAGTELSAAQEEFDGRHGVLAYHRTDQSRGRTAVALPPEAWIVAVGQHPGLIPGSQWAAVQERLRRTDCRTPRDARPVSRSAAVPLRQTDVCQVPPRGRRRALFLCLPCEIDRRTGTMQLPERSWHCSRRRRARHALRPAGGPCRAGGRTLGAAARPA